jgi:hypothetical protein
MHTTADHDCAAQGRQVAAIIMDSWLRGRRRPWASLSLSDYLYMHVLNNSYARMYLCARSVEMGT